MQKLQSIDARGEYERSPVIDGRLNINIARVVAHSNWARKYGAEPITRTLAALVKLGQLAKGRRINTKKSMVPSNEHFVVIRLKRLS